MTIRGIPVRLRTRAPDRSLRRIVDDVDAYAVGELDSYTRLIECYDMPRAVVISWRNLTTPAERLQALAAYLDEVGV